jgi:hypothetical protein
MSGLNVMGTSVPTDHLRLCFFNANKVMIGDKRVHHLGAKQGRYSVMVADKGQWYGEGPPVFKQFRLNRTKAENLYPMTPELKEGQDLVDHVLEILHS